jgi:glycosyltransferase involved in cell wall biosynthesis
MRVGLDVSPLHLTRAGTARVITMLQEIAGDPRVDATTNRRAGASASASDVEIVPLDWGRSGRVSAALRDSLWYPRLLSRAARGAGVDLLHCPSFRGPTRSPMPLVVTVHDLAVLRHPELFNRWTREVSRRSVPGVVAAARLVVAVSEFTRQELAEVLGTPAEKVRVVPNAVPEGFAPHGSRAPGDYVLAVGTLEPRKNLVRLAEAARLADVELRVVGARGWGGVELPPHVRLLGTVDDGALAALYRGALCLAYPSLYEGFGIPIVEAMACGTPVVTSRGGATEEVAGGAAVLVDPFDPVAIAAGIGEAVSRREQLAAAGLERARGFTRERVVEGILGVYREAAA